MTNPNKVDRSGLHHVEHSVKFESVLYTNSPSLFVCLFVCSNASSFNKTGTCKYQSIDAIM